MNENPTMRVAWIVAAALALAGGGCSDGAPEATPQQGMTEEVEQDFQERLTAIEATLAFELAPGQPRPVNISVECDVDPCGRKLLMLKEHRICRSGDNCPTQVRWRAVGAHACWTEGRDSIVIAKKLEAEDCFPAKTIQGPPAGEWTVDSGPPTCLESAGVPTVWSYGVRLEDSSCPGGVADEIDPVVIIEPS